MVGAHGVVEARPRFHVSVDHVGVVGIVVPEGSFVLFVAVVVVDGEVPIETGRA